MAQQHVVKVQLILDVVPINQLLHLHFLVAQVPSL